MTRKIYNAVMIAMFIAFVLVIGAMNLFTAEIMAAGTMGFMRIALAAIMGSFIWWTGFKKTPQD